MSDITRWKGKYHLLHAANLLVWLLQLELSLGVLLLLLPFWGRMPWVEFTWAVPIPLATFLVAVFGMLRKWGPVIPSGFAGAILFGAVDSIVDGGSTGIVALAKLGIGAICGLLIGYRLNKSIKNSWVNPL